MNVCYRRGYKAGFYAGVYNFKHNSKQMTTAAEKGLLVDNILSLAKASAKAVKPRDPMQYIAGYKKGFNRGAFMERANPLTLKKIKQIEEKFDAKKFKELGKHLRNPSRDKRKITIYDIKYRTKETSPYFFDKETLNFFGQKLSDFKLEPMPDGRFLIHAPTNKGHETRRIFDPKDNSLKLPNPVRGGKGQYRHKRLVAPGKFDPRSFRLKKIGKNKKLIIGCPKGKYNAKAGVCRVGTRGQSLLSLKRGNPSLFSRRGCTPEDHAEERYEQESERAYNRIDALARKSKTEPLSGKEREDYKYLTERYNYDPLKRKNPLTRGESHKIIRSIHKDIKGIKGPLAGVHTGRALGQADVLGRFPMREIRGQMRKKAGVLSKRAQKKFFHNPKRLALIGERCLAMEYRDVGKARREGFKNPRVPWRHDFRGGSAKVFGLPDGSVLVKGKKRLWKKL